MSAVNAICAIVPSSCAVPAAKIDTGTSTPR